MYLNPFHLFETSFILRGDMPRDPCHAVSAGAALASPAGAAEPSCVSESVAARASVVPVVITMSHVLISHEL